MNQTSRDYQRKYLRAPFKSEILFTHDGYVLKAQALNISEGGMLLDSIGRFPEDESIPFMLNLPMHPYFKNFNLEKIQSYSIEQAKSKTVRFHAKVVRKIGLDSRVEGMFTSRLGIQFQEISKENQSIISEYVDTFSSNLIFLQVLIDSINSDKNNLYKLRLLGHTLGYASGLKVSYLRKLIEHDYKSLQWL